MNCWSSCMKECVVAMQEGVSLAHQAMTQGFWWPKMRNDAAEYVQKCEQCQKHAHLIHQPAGHLNPISSL